MNNFKNLKHIAEVVDPNYLKALNCKSEIRSEYFKKLKKPNEDEFNVFFDTIFFKQFDINRALSGRNIEKADIEPSKTFEYYFKHYCFNRIYFISLEENMREESKTQMKLKFK